MLTMRTSGMIIAGRRQAINDHSVQSKVYPKVPCLPVYSQLWFLKRN